MTDREESRLRESLRKTDVMTGVSSLALSGVALFLAFGATPQASVPLFALSGVALAVGVRSRRRIGRDLSAGLVAVTTDCVRDRRVTRARGGATRWLLLSKDGPLPWVEVEDVDYESYPPGTRLELVYAPRSKVVLGLRALPGDAVRA